MIAERLKAAREAHKLSQQALAEKAGISLRTQQNYEAGSRSPDSAYFESLAALGIDVLYVLTGQTNSTALSSDEAVLVQMYRAAMPSTKAAALGALMGAQHSPDQVMNKLANDSVQNATDSNVNTATSKPAKK